MIILDTNVVSEPLKPSAAPAVLSWLDQQDIETLFLTAISVAELRFGIAALPSGSKQRDSAMSSKTESFRYLRDASFHSISQRLIPMPGLDPTHELPEELSGLPTAISQRLLLHTSSPWRPAIHRPLKPQEFLLSIRGRNECPLRSTV